RRSALRSSGEGSFSSRSISKRRFEVPLLRWQERERFELRALTVPPYDTSIVSRRKVSRDGYVVVRTNRYSVPWNYAGQWVTVRETPNGWLEIVDGNKLVASHLMLPES